MSQLTWHTEPGSIDTIAESEYFTYTLSASSNTGQSLKYAIIAGKLSNGLTLTDTGIISGTPQITGSSSTSLSETHSFTVRVTNNIQLLDRTFNLTINAIAQPEIIASQRSFLTEFSLGTFYDGSDVNIALSATDPNKFNTLEWKLVNGDLPVGLTLSTTGKITGYISPLNYSSTADASLGWSTSPWDYIPLDATSSIPKFNVYHFTIRVFDGSKYDESNYTLTVVPKNVITVDSTAVTINNDITVDTDNSHNPIIVTPTGKLPTQRAGSQFDFHFEGKNFDYSNILYPIQYAIANLTGASFDQGSNTHNPLETTIGFDQSSFDQRSAIADLGLTLDPNTGWLHGILSPQSEETQTYTFEVYCFKTAEPSIMSRAVTYSLTVLGAVDNTITWVSPTDLGTVDNGDISEFAIIATTPANKTLYYQLILPYQLPVGLELLPNGLLIGRVSFEPNNAIAGVYIDGVFNQTYTFTVKVANNAKVDVATITAIKTFTVIINYYNKVPYHNIYLKALPDYSQRIKFLSIINTNNYFPDELIYRSNDPWFGKATDIKFLFAAGLNPSTASDYNVAMQSNHYRKKINLGKVKTAVALDLKFNVKYEVVYVEVLDSGTNNSKSQYSNTSLNISHNSLDDMETSITSVGLANQGALPNWMTASQPNGKVLGFTRGVVLAYTLPGKSALIEYRLQQSGIMFDEFDFVVDRYQLDQYLSQNWDITAKTFIQTPNTFISPILPQDGDRYLGFPKGNIYS
jgi:hypothetical protein